MTIISEMTIGEIPTVTSLVGASAAPNHAPAVKPDKIPSSCNFRAREVSLAAAPIELVTVDSKAPHNQRNECKSSKPPIKTITGTQN
jgi:hypothetical protein